MFDFLIAALIAAVVGAAPAPVVETPPTTAPAEAPEFLVTDPNDTVPERPVETFPVSTAPDTDDCIPLDADPTRGQRRWSFFDCTP